MQGFPQYSLCPYGGIHWDIFHELHTAGERVKYLDWQGEKGRARNNSQTKQQNKINPRIVMRTNLVLIGGNLMRGGTYRE